MRGGKREGAGRPPGAKNKRSLVSDELKRRIAASGRDPVEYLLSVMETDENPQFRLEAAKAAAPYIRARKTEVTHNEPEPFSVEELTSRLANDSDLMAAIVQMLTASPDVLEQASAAFSRHGFTLSGTGSVTARAA